LKKLGNPITIRDKNNKPIDVENALGPNTKTGIDGREKNIEKSIEESKFKEIFGRPNREKSSEPTLKEYTKVDVPGNIKFWSTSEKPQKIGKAFIFLYTIPSPQESRQQAQLSGTGRNTNANRPMMLMVKDGSEYSLIGVMLIILLNNYLQIIRK
jgi:hypothetical protein